MSAPVTPTIDAGRCRARSRPARATRIGMPPRPRVRPLGDVLAELVRPVPAGEEVAAVPAAPAPVGLPAGPPPSEDPRIAAVVMRLLQAVVEVLDGVRPAAHLRRVCEDAPYGTVAASAPVPVPGRPARRSRSRLRGVRLCAVAPGVVETAAAVHHEGRARALAARLEHDGRDWRFTVLAFL